MNQSSRIKSLQLRIEELEKENALLRKDFSALSGGDSVKVPDAMKPVFDLAQQTVNEYFRNLKMDPSRGTIEINDQRYVLVRASTLSKDFLETVQNLYADRGKAEALTIGKNFLFDIAHVIGMNDARNFHAKMNLTDPISRLSAGPVHFAYSGWAFVDILPESNPSPDEDFYLIYRHPYSFEADSWVRSGKKADTSVCIMNSGYSSGWCEESFGIPLTAVEVSCIAKGDDECLFIMSPPHNIQEHLERFQTHSKSKYNRKEQYEVPTFFERKKVEEEMRRSRTLAEESAQSKSDFVANMSHELRTPLSAILGFTDLLKKTGLDPVQKDYLEAISSSGSSLLSIINDILDISKIDAGKFAIEAAPFNIPGLIHSIQVMFASKAMNKGLAFSVTVDPSINYSVLGDPMRLTQILMNLIGNSIKFTQNGGIYVSCTANKKEDNQVDVHFSIRDTGIGIPTEKIETIFERFTQADPHITRRYGGTGLGLAITKQLVELQGGTISVKSVEGNGTDFQFILPYLITDENAQIPASKEFFRHLQPDSTKSILLVEDNRLNQKLATAILENNGFMVTLAENGLKATEIIKEGLFDLILMDIQMPVMDGYRATQIIRNDLHIDIPVVAMTAHALPGEKEKCIQHGMNDYLSKPFNESDLLLKIAQWTSNRKEISRTPVKKDEKLTDLSFLLAQSKNNPTLVNEMIGIFAEQTPLHIESLQKAVTARDYAAIYKTTHALRNTIGFFGLTQVIGNELLNMEKMARAGNDMSGIESQLEKIIPVLEKAVDELKALNF